VAWGGLDSQPTLKDHHQIMIGMSWIGSDASLDKWASRLVTAGRL
jgi:hypothetical protein